MGVETTNAMIVGMLVIGWNSTTQRNFRTNKAIVVYIYNAKINKCVELKIPTNNSVQT